MIATIVDRAVVNSLGHIVRVVACSGQRWAVARDIAVCVLLQASAVGAGSPCIRMCSLVTTGKRELKVTQQRPYFFLKRGCADLCMV